MKQEIKVWSATTGYLIFDQLNQLDVFLNNLINEGYTILQVIPFHQENNYPRTALILVSKV